MSNRASYSLKDASQAAHRFGEVLCETGIETCNKWNIETVSQAAGSPPSGAALPWSCQVRDGVMENRLDAWLCVRRLAVHAPRPPTMNRNADWVWRWLGAISPGRIS